MNRTAIIADRRYIQHFAGRVHPERPERVTAMIEMSERITRPDLKRLTPREATPDEVALCHRPDYVTTVERSAGLEHFDFDADTHGSRDTWKTAMLAVGGVLTAAAAVADGEVQNAFAIVRPPGHHALPDRAMGFCFFNNVAIAAAWLTRVRGVRRVLILDWDVHHSMKPAWERAAVLPSTRRYRRLVAILNT
jgi:acetoin utilization deacetylase AcuC-like enzyme